VAVTKYASLDGIRELLTLGENLDIAENKVREASAKIEALEPLARKARWHMIGHLQTNKAARAVEVFDTLDSLDSLRLAEALERVLSIEGRHFPALVQVKLTSRETQSGVPVESVGEMIEALENFPHIKVRGLMAIAPELKSVEALRPHFRRMREIFDRFFSGQPTAELSMGMSRDFEIAVEEGATHVRIGSMLFCDTAMLEPPRT
jgi:pyridoxal phosphate enzyme (YggS family)